MRKIISYTSDIVSIVAFLMAISLFSYNFYLTLKTNKQAAICQKIKIVEVTDKDSSITDKLLQQIINNNLTIINYCNKE